MIEPTLRADLVPRAGGPCDLTSCLASAFRRAVDLSDVAERAEVEDPPTPRTPALSKRVVVDHRSTPAQLLAGRRLPCERALVGVRQPDTEGSGWRPWALMLLGVRLPEP